MSLTTGEEMSCLKTVLFPSLLCSVAHLGDTAHLSALETYEPDLNLTDYSGRTALHTAAVSGQAEVVRWLLERGASVHVRDLNNETPLLTAVRAGNMDIVRTLSQCGAHLGLTPPDLADILVTAAAQGKHHLVHCLLVAGASPDLYLCGSGNTGLHAATEVSREVEVEVEVT